MGMTAGFGMSVGAFYVNTSEYGFLSLSSFEGFPLMIPLLFALCFGALLGDIVESFFKRRLGKNRGEDWLVFDQLDFIIGALVLSFVMSLFLQIFTGENWFLQTFSLWHVLTIVLLTPLFHLTANMVFRLAKRRSPKAKT